MAEISIEEIINDYGTYIYNFALKLSANPTDAEDLSQETFIKAWKHISSLEKPQAIAKWLRIICLNEFKMKLRKENKIKLDFTENIEMLERDSMNLIETRPTPIEEVITSDEVKKLRDGCFLAMTRKLTLNQRIAFSLVDMFGLPVDEVANILEVSPKAVKGLLYRARMSLDSFFKGHCNFLDIENPCSCNAWIEFMKTRNEIQKIMKEKITVLDYRDKNYEFDLETRKQVRYYYQNLPEQQPSDEWFAKMIKLFR